MDHLVLALQLSGLGLTAVGAWIAGRPALLTEDQALSAQTIEIHDDRIGNLQAPQIKRLLRQSRAMGKGLLTVFFGSIVQIIALSLQSTQQGFN